MTFVKEKNHMPTISIILPIYNVEQYLPQCLDSFIGSLPEGCEVILVNDGSTDGALAVCEACREAYPDLVKIVNKPNGGLSDARNAGTAVAEGEYIYYLDSDDWITPDAIQKLYRFAVENRCEVVQGGFYYAYEKYLLYDDRWYDETAAPFVLGRDEAMHELIRNNYIKNFAWGKLYRADIVKKYPFPVGRYFEDSYWQHLVMHDVTRYGVMPEAMYYYRQRETGISGAFSTRNLDLLRGYRERIAFVDKHYLQYSDEMKALYRRLAIRMCENAYATGKADIIKTYTDYLSAEGITYNRPIYRLTTFTKRVWDHFFSKRLKRIER